MYPRTRPIPVSTCPIFFQSRPPALANQYSTQLDGCPQSATPPKRPPRGRKSHRPPAPVPPRPPTHQSAALGRSQSPGDAGRRCERACPLDRRPPQRWKPAQEKGPVAAKPHTEPFRGQTWASRLADVWNHTVRQTLVNDRRPLFQKIPSSICLAQEVDHET